MEPRVRWYLDARLRADRQSLAPHDAWDSERALSCVPNPALGDACGRVPSGNRRWRLDRLTASKLVVVHWDQ